MLGYAFWYIGNGSQINFYPRSVGIFHREYFVDFRQEELTLTTDRVILNVKGGYLTGIELVDENAQVIGEYYAAFTGLNLIFMNRAVYTLGWKFGVGPGLLTSKIYNYTDYAITINGAVLGRLENGEVLLLVENLGYGKTIPIPSVYFRGLTSIQNYRFGPYIRFFGDIDLDAGFVFNAKYGVFGILASPSLKNIVAGFSLDVGTFQFRYDYEYFWIGYFTHRIGFNIFWGKQLELEEKIERHERMLAEHEREIRELSKRVKSLESEAKRYAKELINQAMNEKDPEVALMKVELAMAFDSTVDAKKLSDSLRKVIENNKKKEYARRINIFLKNKLYADALAEALLMLEDFPKDPQALRAYGKVKKIVDNLRNRRKVERETRRKYEQSKAEKIEKLLKSGRYVQAASMVNTLSPGPDRIRFMNRLRSIAMSYLRKAKNAISQKKWVEAKYYLEKSIKIYPTNEASGLLSYVEANILKNANYYYLKSLESYQKGDVVKAFAYIKEAYNLNPNNEKYRNVYFRLRNALKED